MSKVNTYQEFIMQEYSEIFFSQQIFLQFYGEA